jgi:peptidoglycan/xylan/chitin deacetylase (PgdA/CDA1 family)
MYHYIEEAPPRADAIRRDLSVPPRRFAEQLAYLRETGYTSITLHDLALALQIGQPLPEKPIILTFDDGYANHYENALPLLREYGFVGTFFVITDCADRGDPNYVSWEQIVTMDREGMEIGSHAYTHVSLHGRDVDYLVWQMLGSREAVEERLHKPVRFFCYPSGDYDELAQHVLHTAHYWGAVTTEPGMEHHSDAMFELRRIRVHGHYGAKELAAAIATFDEK